MEAFTEKGVNSEEARSFAEETIQAILAFKQKIGRKYGKRLYPVMLGNAEAAERLAQLDIDRFGVAKVKFSGTREKPYYSTTRSSKLKPMGKPLALADGAVGDGAENEGAKRRRNLGRHRVGRRRL